MLEYLLGIGAWVPSWSRWAFIWKIYTPNSETMMGVGIIIWKLCHFNYLILSEEKYNLTVDFCSNIENYTDDPIYSEVEQEVLKRICDPYLI